jgi:putative DNA primase/helicase
MNAAQNAAAARFPLSPDPAEALGHDRPSILSLRDALEGPRDAGLTLAQTASRGVDWLWPGRIAAGRVTLLVGDPGLGKSLLALDVAARVTNAQPWPDAPPDLNAPGPSPSALPLPPSPSQLAPSASQLGPSSPSSVLLLCAEDDIADTIRPRLEALGADLRRIIALPPDWSPDDAGMTDAEGTTNNAEGKTNNAVGTTRDADQTAASRGSIAPRPFDLCRDVAALEEIVVRQGNVRLVVIDPLNAYLGNIENCNGPVRKVFRELAAMATRRGLAVLAISHLRKQSGSALHRTIGSLAFTAAARAAWLVAKDPHHPQRRLMLPMKNNLAETGSGLAFTIHCEPCDRVPTVAWSAEPVALDPDEALNPSKEPAPRPHPELDDAVRWLQTELAEGAKRSRKVEVAAEAHGIRLITLRRAFRELGGEAIRDGFGALSAWHWRLPGIGRQEPKPSSDLPWDD